MAELLADLPLAALAVGALALAAYAHVRLRHHTATRVQAEIARLVLIATGLAAGWLGLQWRPTMQGVTAMLVFLVGFGMVHLPAAFILWSKRQRGVYR